MARSQAEISALAGPDTEVFEFAGAAVVPGLVDVHNHHFLAGEVDLFRLSFPPIASFDEIVELVREYAGGRSPSPTTRTHRRTSSAAVRKASRS